MENEQIKGLGAVSILVPAHNEAATIAEMLRELSEVLNRLSSQQGLAWELIVIDDGSTDATAEIVNRFGHATVRLVRHEESRGYGAALKSGMRHAQHHWILIIDADGTYPPTHIPEILGRRSPGRMVVGARVGPDTHVPVVRRPAKWFLTRFASSLSSVRIVDLNSGLRAFPRALAERYIPILPDGFSFTSTITLAAISSGWEVTYVPIDYRRREGTSKIRPLRDTIGFLILIIRTVMFFDPLRVLLPIALLFILSSVVVAVGSLALTGMLMDVTTVILLVTGIQLLVLGMIADAINRRLS